MENEIQSYFEDIPPTKQQQDELHRFIREESPQRYRELAKKYPKVKTLKRHLKSYAIEAKQGNQQTIPSEDLKSAFQGMLRSYHEMSIQIWKHCLRDAERYVKQKPPEMLGLKNPGQRLLMALWFIDGWLPYLTPDEIALHYSGVWAQGLETRLKNLVQGANRTQEDEYYSSLYGSYALLESHIDREAAINQANPGILTEMRYWQKKIGYTSSEIAQMETNMLRRTTKPETIRTDLKRFKEKRLGI